MKLQRAQLLVFALCMTLTSVHAEIGKQHRSRAKSGPGSIRLQMMGQVSTFATVATDRAVTTRGGNITIYVAPPPTGDNATGDGSLASPYATIQFAFLAAVSGDEIRVLPGTYNECINNTAFALGVKKNLNIRADDWVVNGNRTTTILDGTGQCVFPFSVVNLAGSGTGSRFEGFTVTGAAASGVFVLGSGIVTNNVISGNTGLEGGGVYAYPGTCFYGPAAIIVSDNQITNNTADDEGTCDVGGTPCNVNDDCQAGATCLFLGGDGGGVFVRADAVNSGGTGGCAGGDARVTVTNNVIDGNGADAAFGGGMYVLTNTQAGRLSTVTVTQNLISNNSTLPFSIGYGGGIWMGTFGYGTEVIDFINNTVTSNLSTGDGGGISAWIDALDDANHTINVVANDVQLNIAEGGGGGMDLFVFALDLQDPNEAVQLNASANLVLGNDAQGTIDALTLYPGVGGGIISYVVSQRSNAIVELNVFENDVRGNLASVAGGGIAAISTADADPGNDPMTRGPALTKSTVRNNLIAANAATDGGTATTAVGGGIFAYGESFGGISSTEPSKSKIFLNFNTVVQNTSDTGSGGIEMESYTALDSNGDDGSVEVEINHSIIYDNSGYGVGGPQPPAGGVLAPAGGTGIFSVAAVRNSMFMNANGNFESWIVPGPNLFTDALLDASFRPSQCSDTIDAGDPLVSAALEPAPNGPFNPVTMKRESIVNLGHTGATSFAVTTLADASGDGYVDGVDILRLSVAFGSDNGSGARWEPAVDLDLDNFISGIDLALMAADFAKSCP